MSASAVTSMSWTRCDNVYWGTPPEMWNFKLVLDIFRVLGVRAMFPRDP